MNDLRSIMIQISISRKYVFKTLIINNIAFVFQVSPPQICEKAH